MRKVCTFTALLLLLALFVSPSFGADIGAMTPAKGTAVQWLDAHSEAEPKSQIHLA